MTHAGSHDGALVALSVMIAVVASYTSLDLASRTRLSAGWPCRFWLLSAAFVMGGGIWSMHFIGMLAFSVPGIEVSYDLGLTALSLVVPVVVTAIGFMAVSRRHAGLMLITVSGLAIGLGVVAMHYTGMAAMRMPADLRYDRVWVAASVLIAIGAATVAVWLAFMNTGFIQRLLASVAMGLAVSGMHYAAMQGSAFAAHAAVDHAIGFASLNQTKLAALGGRNDDPNPGARLSCGHDRSARVPSGSTRCPSSPSE
jgi:NO-binding membrane sensor protein with MHYT domain